MSELTEEKKLQCYECYVSKYIDGDTLDLNINLGFDTYVIRRIRLQDIDAPEINNTKKSSEEYKAGEVALYNVQYYFSLSSPPYYLFAEHKGLYGRWLGEVWRAVGFESVNDFQISKGLYNGGWSWAVQQSLIEEWYNSPEFHRYGKNIFTGSQTDRMSKGQ